MNAPSLDEDAHATNVTPPSRVTILFMISVHATTREDLVAALDRVSRITLETEEGCLAYDYYLTDGSETNMLVRQVWTTLEDYEAHNRKSYVSEIFAHHELALIVPLRRMILKPAFEHVVL